MYQKNSLYKPFPESYLELIPESVKISIKPDSLNVTNFIDNNKTRYVFFSEWFTRSIHGKENAHKKNELGGESLWDYCAN